MGALVTLLSPLEYLQVRHPLKRAVDRWGVAVPAISGAVAVAFWPQFNLFGTDGLVSGINGLLQILAGFFITSLAVIATFSGTAYKIDDLFEGQAAILDGEPLTRRQFLCHLFAYLALASIFMYLFGIVSISSASSIHPANISQHLREALRVSYAGLYLGGLGHVIGTTLIGLIFLASRMSRVSARDRFHANQKSIEAGAPADAE